MPKTITRSATVRASSYDEKERTFDIVFSTGSEVERGFFNRYYERLSMEPEHIRLDRLNSGAPFLNSHMSYELDKVLGVIVRGSARIEDGKGIATVKLSEREGVQEIAKDIRDGILPNVSVGYSVYKYQDVSERDENEEITKRILLATDWEPFEVSSVAVPADADAQVRGESATKDNIEVIIESDELIMSEKNRTKEPTNEPVQIEQPVTPAVDVEEVRKKAASEAKAAMLLRDKEIRAACSQAGMDEKFATSLVHDENMTVDGARKVIIEKLAERSKSQITQNNVSVGERDESVNRREFMQDAIMHRFNPALVKDYHDGVKKYRHMSLLEMARHCVGASVTGGNVHLLDKNELVSRAFHGTSDFPFILENVVNKMLREGYEIEPQTFAPLVRYVPMSDFKEKSIVQLGEAPQFEEVDEHGEYKSGTIDEGKESYALKTFGKIVAVTRRVIINDDLNALTRVPMMLGQQAAILEGDLVWGIITGNPNMGDGNALFSAAHNNVAAVNAGITIASVGKGREAMRLQKGLDGKTQIRVPVSYLVVPVALETLADQFVSINVRPGTAQPNDYNPFAAGGTNALNVISEARLDANSQTRWYLMSNVGRIEMIEIGTLDGQRGPTITTQQGFEVDGLKIKASYDINTKAIDWRGFYRNDGA